MDKTVQHGATMSDIDRERARLKRLLRSQDSKVLNRRPTNADWSIVENVRHLLWAEQKHLGGFLPGRFEWSRVGITAFRGREYADVGTKPTKDIERVFAECDAVHRLIRAVMKSGKGADAARRDASNHVVTHESMT